jgi:alpha-beta hydrolase superfamily lysophospholipase
VNPYVLAGLILLGVLLLLLCLLLAASGYLYKFAVKSKHLDPSEEQFDKLLIKQGKAEAVPFLHRGRDYYNRKAETAEQLFIRSYDGLLLHAMLFECPDPKGVIVISHGYRSAARHDFAPVLEKYLGLGFHVLAVDHRGHGKSEGEEICFGVKERYDMRDWLLELQKRYPRLPVFLSGISMGATVALLAAALPDCPENLMGVSADCGYSHPQKEVCHVLKTKMKMPVFPLYHLADLICRRRADFSFGECDLACEINGVKVPVLFIHGLADDFVPPYHTERMYDAFSGDKEIVLVEGAGHGIAYLEDPRRVTEVLEGFIDRCHEKWLMQNRKSG